jgi:hypothetical protein
VRGRGSAPRLAGQGGELVVAGLGQPAEVGVAQQLEPGVRVVDRAGREVLVGRERP